MAKFLLGMVLGLGFSAVVLLATPRGPAAIADNEELARIVDADQADRAAGAGKINWALVTPRDQLRLARTKELYRTGGLRSANDYEHAALVLQHGETPEDYLLAHELCVIAIAKGNLGARWLAAASEDRFLMKLNRPQRFGTQYRTEPKGSGHYALYRIVDDVTDAEREEMDTPTLANALARAGQFNGPVVSTTAASPAGSARP